MLITLMFSVVAMKSRTSSSFSYSANEQVCRRWEGAQPERQPSWPVEIFYTTDVMLSLWGGLAAGQEDISFSVFQESEISLGQEFQLYWEFSLSWEFREICENLGGPWSLLRDWLQISRQMVRKMVLDTVYFVYSLLSLLLPLLLVIVLGFLLLPYSLVF